jgi:hypothetical protein
LENTTIGNRQELKWKTTDYKQYKVEEEILKGYRSQVEPLENLLA